MITTDRSEVGIIDEQTVYKYTITVTSDHTQNIIFSIAILSYGAIIQSIYTADYQGKLANVVLGFNDINEYAINDCYLGAIIGRHAGRIAKGEFAANGQSYKVTTNNNGNQLHGGVRGLHKQHWHGQILPSGDGVRLSYTSPAQDEGYPDTVDFIVDYQVKQQDDNHVAYNRNGGKHPCINLMLNYTATPQETAFTLINLTNHSYFNLEGVQNNDYQCNIDNHQLAIDANYYMAIDKQSLATGKLLEVANTSFDFRNSRIVATGNNYSNANQIKSAQQLDFGNGYDHPFLLRKQAPYDIELFAPQSKRCLRIKTSEPYVVFYSGNYLPKPRSALCLETQNTPNAVNLFTHATNKKRSLFSRQFPYMSQTLWEFAIHFN